MLRAFRKYAHRDLARGDSIWHWLSGAQHYGLPTRLLDWTCSPLVAMHFATANIDKSDVDGAIYLLDYEKVHRLLPEALRLILEGEGANVFTVQMLAERLEQLAVLDTMARRPFVLFCSRLPWTTASSISSPSFRSCQIPAPCWTTG
ncbi:MAG: FRG domain-containing protein [Desulfosarcinaceae bacterium]|nr:FRG domain-containing protein [Desulfosarcinaceae bacterium]